MKHYRIEFLPNVPNVTLWKRFNRCVRLVCVKLKDVWLALIPRYKQRDETCHSNMFQPTFNRRRAETQQGLKNSAVALSFAIDTQ